MAELNIPEDQASKIKQEILHKEGENLRKKRQKKYPKEHTIE